MSIKKFIGVEAEKRIRDTQSIEPECERNERGTKIGKEKELKHENKKEKQNTKK